MDRAEIRATNTMNLIANKHTPDYPELMCQPEHLVFVVDDFQRGCRNHHHLGKADYGCRAYSLDGFECYRDTLTDQVIPFHHRRKPELIDKLHFARIKGEVHVLPFHQIPKLDTAMRNRIQFNRVRIHLLAPERLHDYVDNGQFDYVTGLPLPWMLQGFKHHVTEERLIVLRAWMYVARRDYWDQVIDGMNFEHLPIEDSNRDWLRRNYRFNKRRNEI